MRGTQTEKEKEKVRKQERKKEKEKEDLQFSKTIPLNHNLQGAREYIQLWREEDNTDTAYAISCLLFSPFVLDL